jgi:hypothetical protein
MAAGTQIVCQLDHTGGIAAGGSSFTPDASHVPTPDAAAHPSC